MFTDDQDIERQLKAALNVEPSAGFEAGVRRRLQDDRPPRRVALPAWAAAAAAVVVLAGGWLLVTGQHSSDPETAVLTARKPDAAPLAGGPAVPLPPAPGRPQPQPIPSARQAESGKTDVLRDRNSPEVIVPRGQLEAILRIVRDANAGRLAIPEPPPATPAVPSELLITPLVIQPIPVVTIASPGGSGPGPKGLQ